MIKKTNKLIASLLITLSIVSLFPTINAFAETKFSQSENDQYKNFLDTECTKTDNLGVYIRKSDGKYFGRCTVSGSDDVKVSNETVDGDNYYASSDGSLVKNTWESLYNGYVYKWHYYGSDYQEVKYQYKLIDGKKYYFDKNGYLSTGWKKRTADENIKANANDKHWYYFGEDGSITEGWIQSGGKWYYIYSDGLMAYDTTTPDGYYVNKNGVFVN